MYRLDIAQKTDHPSLLAIWEASVRATHHFVKESQISMLKKSIEEHQMFDQANLILLIARDAENKIVGFMGVAGDSLEMIFLLPEALKKGVGRLLISYAIEKLNVKRVEVNEENQDALHFYEHFGFKVVSRSELDSLGNPFPLLFMERG